MRKSLLSLLSVCFILTLSACGSLSMPQNRQEQQAAQAKSGKELLDKADNLIQGYFYAEAEELLKSAAKNNDEKIAERLNNIENLKNELVEYTGAVEHIFVHSLMVYPELAFDNIGHPKDGYNKYMATRDEFLRILPQLRDRGYVLYNINDLFTKSESGAVVRQKIYLPQGKKPLILSQDDVNYYEYMKLDGFATRLLIDTNGEVATEVKDPKGNVSVTRDGDMVPIIDDFLKKYPDFSYRGAKGIIALTGYEGALGYRLKTEENIAEAKKVAEALKASGWLFANHSHTHNGPGYWGAGSKVENIKWDLSRWNTVVLPIIGNTNIFIAPFGYLIPPEGLKVISDGGYNIYCTVGSTAIRTSNPAMAIMGRFEIAGTNMLTNTKYVNEHFFNVESVIDKTRPPM